MLPGPSAGASEPAFGAPDLPVRPVSFRQASPPMKGFAGVSTMRSILLACLLLAAPIAAQSIDSINGVPLDEVGIVSASSGTQFSVQGSGFGGLTGLAKPKVFINSAMQPKKRALKVLEATDGELLVEIKTATAGDFDLTVQPKGKGLLPLVAEDVIRIVLPTFEAPSPEVVGPDGLVTLTGALGPETFGHKNGKVKVGGKAAKLVEWNADTIVFRMPTKLADGIYSVEVTNKIAKAVTVKQSAEITTPLCLTMDGSSFDVGGPDRFSCRLNNKKYAVDTGGFLGFLQMGVQYTGEAPYDLTVFGNVQPGDPGRDVRVHVQLDLSTATFPLVIHGSDQGAITTTYTTMPQFLLIETTEWSTLNDGPTP
jgi:hypothetical protein